MGEELFRKKNLDRVQSPEDLNDYVRVSNPGVWMVLASIIVLLFGACVWGIFGHVDSTVAAEVQVENGEAICYVASENMTSVALGATVRFADTEALIVKIDEAEDGRTACVLRFNEPTADGIYDGAVVVGSVNPMSFVLN